MKMILISGKAQSGKDTTAKKLCEMLEHDGSRVRTIHFADLLKYICRKYMCWNGEKDEYGRSLLQYIGTNVVRKEDPDYWVRFVVSLVKLFDGWWDYVIVPDCRFPNEITYPKEVGVNTCHIRVERDYYEDGMSDEQRQHISETALDDVEPDYIIRNNGTYEELYNEINKFLEVYLNGLL